ncbi:MAG: SemiSWEET family transporter [Alphaproteobacteria bacterium]
MSPSAVQMVGWFAMVVSVISLMPQVWKTWTSRSAHDISLGWLVTALLGTIGWVVYGAMLPAVEVMITNALVAGLVVVLLVMKVIFRNAPR